jgi:hypothetical protein
MLILQIVCHQHTALLDRRQPGMNIIVINYTVQGVSDLTCHPTLAITNKLQTRKQRHLYKPLSYSIRRRYT